MHANADIDDDSSEEDVEHGNVHPRTNTTQVMHGTVIPDVLASTPPKQDDNTIIPYDQHPR